MGLFTKEEKVPSIPKAPVLPELPKPKVETPKKDLPGLPSFPANSKNENLNQEMVKSAVTDMPSPGENEVHVEIPQGIHVRESAKEESKIPPMPSPKPSITESPVLPSIPTISKEIEPQPIVSAPQSIVPTSQRSTLNEPIFVRIDKFQSSQKNMEQIKEKIEKIETVLKKIEDVRSKEEVELKSWTEDIGKIKSRLAEVDADIFDQI